MSSKVCLPHSSPINYSEITRSLKMGLPKPIGILRKFHVFLKVLDTVFPDGARKRYQIPSIHEIETDKPFQLNLLPTGEGDSFYRSIAREIYRNEINKMVIKEAILQHGMQNLTYFQPMYELMKPSHADTLESYLQIRRLCDHMEGSFVELYIAAHLFQEHIALLTTEDPTLAVIITPNFEKPTTCPESALMLGATHIEDDEGYFYFNPIQSYIYKNTNTEEETDYSTSETESDESIPQSSEAVDDVPYQYKVTLIPNDGNGSKSILFCFMKKYSTYLAEFCGKHVRTNLSMQSLERLYDYIMGHKKRDTYLDAQLYEFAKFWVMSSLTKAIELELSRAPIEHMADFVNLISLTKRSTVYGIIEHKLFDSSAHDLNMVNIVLSTDEHRSLNKLLARLVCCKNDAVPITQDYFAPHIVVSLDLNDIRLAKYNNGRDWKHIYLPAAIKEALPYLKQNKYCVTKGNLYFLKDNKTVGFIPLLNEYNPNITYISIPNSSTNLRLAATSNPNIILVMSDEMQRLICKIEVESNGRTNVSDWIQLSHDKYSIRFIEKAAIMYMIEDVTCVLHTGSTDDNVFGIVPKNDVLYCYDFRNIDPVNMKNITVVQVKRPPGQIQLLFPREMVARYIHDCKHGRPQT